MKLNRNTLARVMEDASARLELGQDFLLLDDSLAHLEIYALRNAINGINSQIQLFALLNPDNPAIQELRRQTEPHFEQSRRTQIL